MHRRDPYANHSLSSATRPIRYKNSLINYRMAQSGFGMVAVMDAANDHAPDPEFGNLDGMHSGTDVFGEGRDDIAPSPSGAVRSSATWDRPVGPCAHGALAAVFSIPVRSSVRRFRAALSDTGCLVSDSSIVGDLQGRGI